MHIISNIYFKVIRSVVIKILICINILQYLTISLKSIYTKKKKKMSIKHLVNLYILRFFFDGVNSTKYEYIFESYHRITVDLMYTDKNETK